MATLNYWTGTAWEQISTGSSGGGAPGPAGKDGQSVAVFVQPGQPTPTREGDVWLFNGIVQRASDFPPMPESPPAVVSQLPESQPATVTQTTEPNPLIVLSLE